MRCAVGLLCAAAGLLLAACAPTERCNLVAEHAARFSAETPDEVEARALGERCNGAAALLVVRDAEGVPVWAWAAPFYPTFGDSFVPHAEGAGPTRKQLEDFLTRWAKVSTARTGAAPAWSEDIDTRLPQAVYEDVRARDLPMLCHLAAVAREQCVYWEPAAAVATAFYVRDVGAPPPPELSPETSDRK
jgi:hypothetical protein